LKMNLKMKRHKSQSDQTDESISGARVVQGPFRPERSTGERTREWRGLGLGGLDSLHQRQKKKSFSLWRALRVLDKGNGLTIKRDSTTRGRVDAGPGIRWSPVENGKKISARRITKMRAQKPEVYLGGGTGEKKKRPNSQQQQREESSPPGNVHRQRHVYSHARGSKKRGGGTTGNGKGEGRGPKDQRV